ncbi:MAG: putative DNA-binding domain-containing protein [Candidatus Binataceae bacterium]|nr:putative DNA-binding domain-containing protein [Candidatus Binataceae bacterium]
MSELKKIQQLIYALVARPTTIAGANDFGPGAIDSVIAGDEKLRAARRIQIYADAYFARLLGIMKEDFPAVLKLAGEETFTKWIHDYLMKHPPADPSIFPLGRNFAGFLADRCDIDDTAEYPFIAELAALERATIEVFHGPEAETLTAAAMRSIPAAQWAAIELRTHPALQMLDCRWAVDELLRMITNAEPWHQPDFRPIGLVVWREQSQVYYRRLEPGERSGLEIARHGATFATLCEAASAEIEGDAVAAINRMLARWLADGLIVKTS